MRWQQLFPIRWNSLFIKLLTGFLIIIILLLSFNVIAITLFRKSSQQEVIANNTLLLNNTVESYEKQFRLVQSLLLRFYLKESLNTIWKDRESPNYITARNIITEINTLLSNEMLFLDNLLIVFTQRPFVLEKEGTANVEDMFTKYYTSKPYNSTFWLQQSAADYAFNVFPAAPFQEIKFDKKIVEKGTLMPIVIKNNFNSQYMLVALIYAEKMFQAYHSTGKDSFFILNESGQTLFQSKITDGHHGRNGDSTSEMIRNASQIWSDKAILKAQAGYFTQNDHYYFYKKGTDSGLLYVNMIPNVSITSQIAPQSLMLIAILVISIVTSLLISILLSMKFNHPIQGILTLMQKNSAVTLVRSKIHELGLIGDNIKDLIHTHSFIYEDLNQKNIMLKGYSYINKINSIYQSDDLKNLIETNKPFYLIIFQLAFTRQIRSFTISQQEKASYLIKELIQINMNASFTDSITLQMEKDRILTLVFGEEEHSTIQSTLLRLQQLFNNDKEYGYLTIALHPERNPAEEITMAYEKTVRMLRQRLLNDETQIITEWQSEGEGVFHMFSSAQEQQLIAHLQAGSETRAQEQIRRHLVTMEQSGAKAYQFSEFGKEVVTQVIKWLLTYTLDVNALLYRNPGMEECTSLQAYELFFQSFISEAVGQMNEKKALKDPIIDFVLDYVCKHFGEQTISLELVADKSGLSRGYLSTYFHEKMGMTFSDYLNDLRINSAKETLRSTNTQIQDVAAQVGYQNVNSFIRMFKRICGVTPGEFRRMSLHDGGGGE